MAIESILAEAEAEGFVLNGVHYSTGRELYSANWQRKWQPGSQGTMPPGIMAYGGWAIFAYGEDETLAGALRKGLNKARSEQPVSTIACFKHAYAPAPAAEEDLFS